MSKINEEITNLRNQIGPLKEEEEGQIDFADYLDKSTAFDRLKTLHEELSLKEKENPSSIKTTPVQKAVVYQKPPLDVNSLQFVMKDINAFFSEYHEYLSFHEDLEIRLENLITKYKSAKEELDISKQYLEFVTTSVRDYYLRNEKIKETEEDIKLKEIIVKSLLGQVDICAKELLELYKTDLEEYKRGRRTR